MDNDEAGRYLNKPMQLLFLLYIKKNCFLNKIKKYFSTALIFFSIKNNLDSLYYF